MASSRIEMMRYEVLDECFSDDGKDFFMGDLIEAVKSMLVKKDLQPVSKRTIQNDINKMKRFYGIELREDLLGGESGREKIYRYKDTNFSIKKGRSITPKEANQLLDTIQMLQRFKGLPNWKELELVMVWLKVRFHLDGLSEGTVMFAQNPYLKGLEHFGELVKAVMGKKKIAVKYAPFGRPKKVRKVHPYQLRQWNYRWFLIGHEDRKELKMPYVVIPIDRIEGIKRIYSRGFIPQTDKDFDFEKYFENIVGVSLLSKNKKGEDAEPIPVVAKVYYPNAWYIDTKPIHSSQRVLDSTKGWIIGKDGVKKPGYKVFQWDVIPNEEFIQALLVYADQMEVREPKWVKEKLIERARHIMDHNGFK